MHQVREVWANEADGEGTVVINSSDFTSEMVSRSIESQHPEVASMIRWGRQTQRQGRRGGLIERDKYVTPSGIYDQMRVAQDAARTDDVVSGYLETTEALAFSRMSIESDDEDEEDILNQIMTDIKLDSKIREMWREVSTISQVYMSIWWGEKDYKVRGRDQKTGVKRKKEFKSMKVPLGLTILDPMKIIPVGNFMFGQEQLAWIANREECTLYDNVLSGREQDATIQRLITGPYIPTEVEMQRLGRFGVGPGQLYLLNPDTVWRVTSTRPDYEPFADVRLKSVFDLLDLKALLRELDRAMLLGATNFIVLIRKGTENMPAKNAELSALQASVRTLSQLPVIVGDHRLTIDIITPKLDTTLEPAKYNTLNASITARLYQILNTGNFAAGSKNDDSLKLIKIISRGLESRRGLLRRSIDEQILMKIYEKNQGLTEIPYLEFHPKSIAIDFDPGLAAYLMDLLDRHAISRGTVLEQIDLDEDDEARVLKREHEYLDDIFNPLTPLQDPAEQQKFAMQTTKVEQQNIIEQKKMEHEQQLEQIKATPAPVASPAAAKAPVKKTPANADPKGAGRTQGGNRNGGGAAPGTGQGQARDPRRKAKS